MIGTNLSRLRLALVSRLGCISTVHTIRVYYQNRCTRLLYKLKLIYRGVWIGIKTCKGHISVEFAKVGVDFQKIISCVHSFTQNACLLLISSKQVQWLYAARGLHTDIF